MPKTWRLEDNESPPGSPDTAVGMDDLEMQSGRVHETKTEFGSFGGSFGTSSYALLEGQFPRKSDVERLVAHPHGEAPEPPAHYSHRAPQLRAMVLGANDGLVGTASLMLGVSGGHGGLAVAVLAGLSGLFAGAASMAVGEYVSVASQRDSELADLARERSGFLAHPLSPLTELSELTNIYISRGYPEHLAKAVAEHVHSRPLDEIVKVHAREELGIDTEELSRPWTAAWTSAVAFSCGGAFPLLAGAFITDPSIRVWAIGGVTTLALAVSGALGAILGGAPWKWASLRVVLGGWVAMLMTFGIGKAFGVYGMELELD